MYSLDVGCSKSKREGIGLDIKKQVGIDIQADAEHLPFKSGCFRNCSIFMCLEHVNNPDKVLSEIKQVLASNGTISGSVPLHSKMTIYQLKQILLLRLKFALAIHKCLLNGDHKWQFSIKGLSCLLATVGFQNISVTVIRKFPFLDGEIWFNAKVNGGDFE